MQPESRSTPDFLIVGSMKSGTTTLHAHLSEHPSIFMPELKEPHFFMFDLDRPDWRSAPPQNLSFWRDSVVRDIDHYHDLFCDALSGQLTGEASVHYLDDDEVPYRAAAKNPELKVVAILRDPAERAFSHFLHNHRYGIESKSNFIESLNLEKKRMANNPEWGFLYAYRYKGMYDLHVSRWMNALSPKQVKCVWFEDLKTDPLNVYKEVCKFLMLDSTYCPNIRQIHNRPVYPRFNTLERLKSQITQNGELTFLPSGVNHWLKIQYRKINQVRPTLSKEDRKQMIQQYSEMFDRLEALTGPLPLEWRRCDK